MTIRTSGIKVLSDEVVGKISAGEVIERPASVVKELLENALDAGAKSISVHIESSGKSLIRVADDGVGMSMEDLLLACSRHATSKLSEVDDLDNIRTLGFRGEALSSIAAVSQMDLSSSDSNAGEGAYIYVESGQVLRKRPVGRSRGTTVEVRNLFYNVPARKKFLSKDATELSEIVRIVGRYVLAATNVGFKLSHGKRTLLQASQNMPIKERIELVLGKTVASQLDELPPYQKEKVRIEGFFSQPGKTSKDKKGQVFFLNRRYVRSRTLERAVYSAYKSLLEKARHPACVLFIEVPPDSVDVNVHPTKLQIKFKDEGLIRNLLQEALRSSFDAVKGESTSGSHFRLISAAKGGEPERLVFDESRQEQGSFTYEYDRSPNTSSGGNRPPAQEDRAGASIPALYQIGDCYIASVLEEKVVITDQHAAHERVFFEIFSKAREGRSVETQNLLFPVRIELAPEECLAAKKLTDSLTRLGFLIEEFGERSFVVQAVPAVLKKSDIEGLVRDIISDITVYDLEKIDIMDELVKIASCRAAVKSGDRLSRSEMLSLLEELSRCELPFTCPHGRPVTIELTVDDLEKMFRRK